MNRLLTATHFKTQPRTPLTAMPSTIKLAALWAGSVSHALSRCTSASWRVALDRLEMANLSQSDGFAEAIRFESAHGTMVVRLAMDRPAISALIEAALGGNGTESPFDMGERPLSMIEIGILSSALDSVASEMAHVLSNHFDKPFAHFPSSESGGNAPTLQERIVFRFLVNVFGYSGEFRVSIAQDELEHQMTSVAIAEEGPQQATAQLQLQQQVGKSHVEFAVTLGPEYLAVQDITALHVGKMLALSSGVSTPVTLMSGGVSAFKGSLARTGDRMAICITAVVS